MNEIVPSSDQTDFFCADLSRAAGEPMIGTTPAVDAWFLLQYNGPWRAKATEDNDLPPATQEWLAGALALTERGRIQFIKQPQTSAAAGVTLFVALAREVAPLLYEFQLDAYDDLYSVDLPGLLAGDAADQHLRADPLYLVCTNGRRDRCCSRLGLSLYYALDQHVGDAAWQCTHLGGHRFAPTMVTFPDGACYGRLTAADLAPMIQAQQAGQLYLSHLRGRGCYDKLGQAAEYLLRHNTGQTARDAYRLLDARLGDDSLWAVRISEPATGAVHQVTLRQTAVTRPVSCSPAKSKPVPHFHLVSVKNMA